VAAPDSGVRGSSPDSGEVQVRTIDR
jgi:hypothetical protein